MSTSHTRRFRAPSVSSSGYAAGVHVGLKDLPDMRLPAGEGIGVVAPKKNRNRGDEERPGAPCPAPVSKQRDHEDGRGRQEPKNTPSFLVNDAQRTYTARRLIAAGSPFAYCSTSTIIPRTVRPISMSANPAAA